MNWELHETSISVGKEKQNEVLDVALRFLLVCDRSGKIALSRQDKKSLQVLDLHELHFRWTNGSKNGKLHRFVETRDFSSLSFEVPEMLPRQRISDIVQKSSFSYRQYAPSSVRGMEVYHPCDKRLDQSAGLQLWVSVGYTSTRNQESLELRLLLLSYGSIYRFSPG
ncbi:hypothetical protein AVEN_195008-1 [Araneus ventricosus]|uniref:Uncharacterized protein n=1 Tax=Araneus ventricosus TaxID=182803 RepID=A0A4Y2TH56_ARAVE|nr:hypothetical protein AVEN_195008-1 [Araneus ventricosus]